MIYFPITKDKSMKQTRILMGMPIEMDISDRSASPKDMEEIFSYFDYVEKKFSVFKKDSEISLVNAGKILKDDMSGDMREVFDLAEKTKEETGGYFNIVANDGKYNPSGIVKGWAIHNASKLLIEKGFRNFYVNAGGDIEAYGKNPEGNPWRIGIRNPFNIREVVKVIYLEGIGVATSGTYIRGQHVYNPHERNKAITNVVSLTVVGPNVYEADRFATAAFAMEKGGIEFIEILDGFEGYMIDKNGQATMTSGFERYTEEPDR